MRRPLTDTTSGRGAPPAIRAARESDWDAIAALLSATALPLDGAHDHIGGFVVAERDGAIVGCAAVERHDHAGLLRSVAVAGTERGRGLGVALVERCVADAAAAGVSMLVLLTTTAERFFPRFGFSVAGRDGVPDAVRQSAEFQGACPSSAVVMMLELHDGRSGRATPRSTG